VSAFFVTDTGDVVELDVPNEGTFRRDWHDAELKAGRLRPVGDDEQVRTVETVLGYTRDGKPMIAVKYVLEAVAVATVDEPEAERAELLQQARDLGLEPHGNAGVARLRSMIEKATAPQPEGEPEGEPDLELDNEPDDPDLALEVVDER
jgi:hypothetical protein